MCLTKSKYLFILLVLSVIIVFSGCAKTGSSISAGKITEDGRYVNNRGEIINKEHVRRDIENALEDLENIYSSKKESRHDGKATLKERVAALKKVNNMVRDTGTLLPVFFDYNRHSIKEAARGTLKNNAEWLGDHPSLKILVVGHADNRGSNEYNLALGHRRAKNVLYYLRDFGVKASIRTVTFGEEKPNCFESTETCWSQNRRAEFAVVAAD